MASIRNRNGKWQVQIRRASQRPISRTFILRKDAVQWARELERQADRGDLPKDARTLRQLSLGDLVRRYRDSVSVHKAGYENECIVLGAFLRHSICTKRLSELRPEDFAEYRDERLRTIKPTTLKRQLNPLHHMFEVARDEWGLPIRTNPLRKLKIRLVDKARERRLRPGELDQLLSANSQCRNKLIGAIILFGLATAMRRGEMLAMRWADYDPGRKALVIPQSKNGMARVIPLSQSAMAILNRLPRGEERVFPITANSLRLAWSRILNRAGISDLHFHDLRHEAISVFFEQGLSVPEVALISGHKNMKQLFRYAHAVHQAVLAKLEMSQSEPMRWPVSTAVVARGVSKPTDAYMEARSRSGLRAKGRTKDAQKAL